MRNKHTPAPWFAVQYANEWNIQSKDGYEGACTNVLDEEEDENHAANAQLIAASPELLDALNIMTSLCRIKYGNLDKDVYNEILKAESIIAKATGKEVSDESK